MIISKVKRKRFRVDMAPLIDVVFLLLIFFMLTFAMQGKGMDISLPAGSSASDQVEEPLTINIGNDNSIRVNSHPVPLGLLHDKIKEIVGIGQTKTVVIESGEKARYELFAQVLDVARQAGVKDFSIIRDVE
jgi:biopolymer transport protein ExbD